MPALTRRSSRHEAPTPGKALAEGIAAFGLDLGPAVQQRLLAYLALLEKWNRTYSLTGVRDPARMVSHHLLDSLAILPQLPQKQPLRLLDLGSGAGLPGIPLALARPQWEVTLLDSRHKQAAFLRQATVELELANVEVIAARVERFVPARPFDVIVSRAFSDLSGFADASTHLLDPRGRLVAMKARYPAEELARLPATIRAVAVPRLAVPGIAGERHLVIMEAIAS